MEAALREIEARFEAHGAIVIALNRFVPALRAFFFIAAGLARMNALAVLLWFLGMAQAVWAMPAVLFILMIAYHGVRQGRSTYLVDMAPKDSRAASAAVSNTVIGVLLLLAGVLGGGAALIGPQATLMLFAAMAVAAAVLAHWLPEVEHLAED